MSRTSQGWLSAPRPTIIPAQPVSAKRRRAAAGDVTSPLAITGMWRAASTTRRMALRSASPVYPWPPGATVDGNGRHTDGLQAGHHVVRHKVIMVPAQSELDRDGNAYGPGHFSGNAYRLDRIAKQSCAGAVVRDLPLGTAHVDIDQRRAMGFQPLRSPAQGWRIRAIDLVAERIIVLVCREQRLTFLTLALEETGRAQHLRIGKPNAAVGAQAKPEREVRVARHGSQEDRRTEGQAADRE